MYDVETAVPPLEDLFSLGIPNGVTITVRLPYVKDTVAVLPVHIIKRYVIFILVE
jgi:hypothetical protein